MEATFSRKRKFSEIVTTHVSYNSLILSEIKKINEKIDMKIQQEDYYKDTIKKLKQEIRELKEKLEEKIENYNYFE